MKSRPLEKRRYKAGRSLLLVLLFITLVLGTSVSLAGAGITQQPMGPTTTQDFDKKLSDQWGIELTSLRMTAAGHMVDFRYRVLDAEKAGPLFERKTKPYLVHQETGKVLAVPNTAKVGALRNSNIPKPGRIYWMFFGNNGQVKQGDKVSVVIGDFKAENLVVE